MNQEEGTHSEVNHAAYFPAYRTVSNEFVVYKPSSGISVQQFQRTKTGSQAHIFFKLEFSMHLLIWSHSREGSMKDGLCSWLFLGKSKVYVAKYISEFRNILLTCAFLCSSVLCL